MNTVQGFSQLTKIQLEPRRELFLNLAVTFSRIQLVLLLVLARLSAFLRRYLAALPL
ncbi:hypothetical protein [Microcoleus sp. FACHB-68]|uniref:hypothetical protein n=1 Tax=Microcoleus sp. FACHB-68 TaxID=2692826 RepID=UPI0016847CE9|nr:hypothetical protein [Microcoleus sp. FACHB-68]MBD1937489.1 hypothetical protein [Microcoleus sp. FACHB-68]